MTKHRFFISPENFIDGRVTFPKDLQSQISRVLRLKAGDEVEVLDNQGKAFLVKLAQGPDQILFGEILSSRSVDTDPLSSADALFWPDAARKGGMDPAEGHRGRGFGVSALYLAPHPRAAGGQRRKAPRTLGGDPARSIRAKRARANSAALSNLEV